MRLDLMTRCFVAVFAAGAGAAFAVGCRGSADTAPTVPPHERVAEAPQRVVETFRRDYPGVEMLGVDHQVTAAGPIIYRFIFVNDGQKDAAFYYYNGRRASLDDWRFGDQERRD